jgi:AbrB family looped-hinge helix DNA binding protein
MSSEIPGALQTNLTVAPNGRVVIPASMRAALGCAHGGTLLARLTGGVVILEPVDAAIRRAQDIIARYIPPGSGLVDELIRDRRDEASRE